MRTAELALILILKVDVLQLLEKLSKLPANYKITNPKFFSKITDLFKLSLRKLMLHSSTAIGTLICRRADCSQLRYRPFWTDKG